MSALERRLGASSVQRPFAERLPRRRSKTAWTVAVAVPLLLTAGARGVAPAIPPATTLFVALLVAVLVALVGGVGPALAATLVTVGAQEVFFSFPYGSLDKHDPVQASILVVFLLVGAGVGTLVDELVRLTAEQTALRRIALLVGRGRPPAEVFSAVADEVAQLLSADSAVVAQFGPDGLATILAVAGDRASEFMLGERWHVEPSMTLSTLMRTGRPARSDYDGQISPQLRERLRRTGIRSSVGSPIVVEGQLWGGVVASSSGRRLPPDTEQRLLNFTELVATAIANAESRAELTASRARIVAASDEARRRVERDLHDGVQQRLVSLALEVRAAQSLLPSSVSEAESELSHVVEGLTSALDELREIARGIHPAILAQGGLGPALKTLARRAPIPVALEVRVKGELPDAVEVAAYYAVAELVTNAAKHAQASKVDVAVEVGDGGLRIEVRDDGDGGADPARGTGLVGLRDRVETLGGSISVSSPIGDGTAVEVLLPFEDSG
jgi:signal transduction histidine kinase